VTLRRSELRHALLNARSQSGPEDLDPAPIEVLDLRHFSAAQLRPVLRDEAQRWNRRLQWDYVRASDLLLDYIDGRILPGFVALRDKQILGYAFGVFEADKAVIGDVYAFDETEGITNPVCDVLLDHLLESLQATPGVERAESQLLMFPAGALAAPFRHRGFRSSPRLFMACDLHSLPATQVPETPSGYNLQAWRPEFYNPAAALIHRAYAGHMDSSINDQYRTLHGAQRFLHNIIRFPGCGLFEAENSWALRNSRTNALEGLLLCSRVRSDVVHITQLCIDPSLRGRGLGQHMLHHFATQIARRHATSISLTVTEANTPALRLYQRNGFVTQHRFEAMVWDSRAES
jgi:GNAT superfamily N-acetyltransferase